MPSVVTLITSSLMTNDDVFEMPNGDFLCNSPAMLGKRLTQDRVESFWRERDTERDDFRTFPTLRAYLDCTMGFCLVRRLNRENMPDHLRHLSDTTMEFYCASCPSFHNHLECAAQQFLHLGRCDGIDRLLRQPLVGRDKTHAKRGRRRARGNWNSGNPSDTMANLGLSGSNRIPAITYMSSATTWQRYPLYAEKGKYFQNSTDTAQRHF